MSYPDGRTTRKLTLYERHKKFFEVSITAFSLLVGVGFSGYTVTSMDDLQLPLWFVIGAVAFFMLIAFVFSRVVIYGLRAIDREVKKLQEYSSS